MTYFQKVFRVSPSLGVLCGVFALLSIFVNIIKYQITPFFLWGMFSQNAPLVDTYEVEQYVTISGDTLNYTNSRTPNFTRTMIVGTSSLSAAIASRKMHPVAATYNLKIATRLRKWHLSALEPTFLYEKLQTKNSLAQLPADSIWRVRFLENYYGVAIKNSFMQRVAFTADGHLYRIK